MKYKKLIVDQILQALTENIFIDSPCWCLPQNIFDVENWELSINDTPENYLLENGGIFEALHAIKQYEERKFGQLITDLTQPNRVVTSFINVKGIELLNESKVWKEHTSDYLDEEITAQLIQEFQASKE